MKQRLIMAGCVALSACSTATPMAANQEEVVPVHGETGKVCNAAAARPLVGRLATQALGAEALRLSGAGALRWMRPGDIVTMEYRSDRLNIHLDAQNKVSRFACG